MNIWTLTVTEQRHTRTLIGTAASAARSRTAIVNAITALTLDTPRPQRYHAHIDGHLVAVVGIDPAQSGLVEILEHLLAESPSPEA